MLGVARYGTRDLARAAAFYDRVAAPLGGRRVLDRPEVVGYQAGQGGMFLVGLPFAGEATVGNGTQVGWPAPSRAVVDEVYAVALAAGGSSEGAPGLRGEDANGFYAAYFRDPEGNKVMVFRYGPPDAA